MERSEWYEFRREVKEEWRRLWRERIDDKFRAEGIAVRDYHLLFLNRGTVIFASRDAKIPGLREILETWAPDDLPNAVPPDPDVGGWGKFIKTKLRKHGKRRKRRVDRPEPSKKREKQQLKKGGHGWLHM